MLYTILHHLYSKLLNVPTLCKEDFFLSLDAISAPQTSPHLLQERVVVSLKRKIYI